jgi:hypothetical protein
MRILAIDPPGRKEDGTMAPTGFAWYDDSPTREGFHIKGNICAEQQTLEHSDLYSYLGREYVAYSKALKVIVEPFTFQQNHQHRTKIDYTPAEFVGVVKMYCQYFAVPLILSPASSAVGRTAFFGDSREGNEKLKKLGVWDPGLVPHGMDAMRHLMKHLVFDLGQSWRLEVLR